ncbi:nucleoside-diphosphate kinase [Staphylococcus massiliensis]|uniref:Nucleoside diphosphate kinase n=1 Tax=Staphylococcus massiliensis S46 TaxID=1229783 RepID=K9AUQ7_9STAP|nr:nucleoside-diphosphate kinase [Staphylococcus massiliensis]EKU49796.1 mulitfunctional nucleoside diphosphate kinase/apyrimidinic endonuclease/3'-phosphodiesterase [Staphylococcus massiliensis S46]MCG3398901.1 nucleoside-diphosphate kinase [Staphylococcus massiliensis]MCG3401096.1 nucleoside-diphosphate kinase [Staphylococcus massiliensis]MCG3412232.1 nucleoside-diphosphate kinase [Staphylococcus massiliensis]POA01129.1 nucleoside-diphosphate kinase [Staphylococcus massiliensis CCUG 55927]
MERTFLMLKPDAVQRNLIGEVVSRLEKKGLKLVGAKLMTVPKSLAEEHYKELSDKPFYDGLISFITSAPVFAMVVEGEDVVNVTRTIIGSTNPTEATPGTIRADYGLTVGRNVIHGSDSNESAEREINLWFNEDELTDYKSIQEPWIYE